MKQNQNSVNIKLALFIVGLTMSSLIFWVNQQMVKQLRLDAQRQVEYLAKAYTKAINSSDEYELDHILFPFGSNFNRYPSFCIQKPFGNLV